VCVCVCSICVCCVCVKETLKSIYSICSPVLFLFVLN
jgi:hypothetical protein